jgi:hypothetical protein
MAANAKPGVAVKLPQLDNAFAMPSFSQFRSK